MVRRLAGDRRLSVPHAARLAPRQSGSCACTPTALHLSIGVKGSGESRQPCNSSRRKRNIRLIGGLWSSLSRPLAPVALGRAITRARLRGCRGEPVLHREPGRLHPAAEAEVAVDGGQVAFDRRRARGTARPRSACSTGPPRSSASTSAWRPVRFSGRGGRCAAPAAAAGSGRRPRPGPPPPRPAAAGCRSRPPARGRRAAARPPPGRSPVCACTRPSPIIASTTSCGWPPAEDDAMAASNRSVARAQSRRCAASAPWLQAMVPTSWGFPAARPAPSASTASAASHWLVLISTSARLARPIAIDRCSPNSRLIASACSNSCCARRRSPSSSSSSARLLIATDMPRRSPSSSRSSIARSKPRLAPSWLPR